MKIAIMSGWNVGSGSSVHSELIGREFAKNNELVVFTFYKNSFHGQNITGEDEDYVIRCFTKRGDENPIFDSQPILEEDYDVFIVEDLGMLPIEELKKIFPEIKKKAKTINVIHDGKNSDKPGFHDFEWDAVVCFDERYKQFLMEKYPEEKLHIIPYPSTILKEGNKKETREKLGLPLDKKIIFSFGRLPYYMDQEIEVIDTLFNKYNLLWLSVTGNKKVVKKIKEIKEKRNGEISVEVREKDLNINELYDYLHASDALIFPKTSSLHVVVSSTIYQCLGSLCPIVARDSNFVKMFSGEVLKYKDHYELESALEKCFSQGVNLENLKSSVKKYLNKYSSIQIAEMFKELAKKL